MDKIPILKNATIASRFWMLILLFIIFLGVSSGLATLIILPYADLKNLGNLEQLIQVNPQIVTALKIAQMLSAIGAFIIPSCLFAFLVERKIGKYLHLNTLPSKGSMVAVLLLMLSAMPLINWMAEINSRMSLPGFMAGAELWMKNAEAQAAKLTEVFLKMNSFNDLFLNMFIIAFLAAVGEEFFFRGALQKTLIEWTRNSHKGIWLTAILFSAFHMQFYGFFPRVIMGALLGYLSFWSNSLWLSILAHFINNGAAVIFAFLAQRSVIDQSKETIGAGEGERMYLFVSIAIVSALLWSIYNMEKSRKPPDFSG